MARSTAFGLTAVVLITAVGLRLLTGGTSAATDDEQTTTPPPSTVAAPVSTDELGVSHGWTRDRAGAVSAAVAAVRMTGSIAVAGFITRSDMIAALATERYAPTLASESANQLVEMTAALGAASVVPADLTWSELPLTARAVETTDDSVIVEVWSVLVIGVTDRGAPRQAWRTVTVMLAWEHDDWKVDGWSATSGPTPMLEATTAIATAHAISEVVAWPPVGGE